MLQLPRLFVASSGSKQPAPVEPSWVIDRLVVAGPDFGADGREVVVGLDALGGLALHAESEDLLPSLRAHLAHAEVTGQRRRIACASSDATGLWLFAVELVEQLPDAPGINDAVYLYGTLYPASDAAAEGVRGQLTSTRADLLRGFVDGFDHAFRFPPDEAERAPRAFHLLLPGDRPDALAQGNGIVLAYPIVDTALLGEHAGNDLALMGVVHDLLAAMRTEIGKLPAIPVPDRSAALDALRAEGWDIDERTNVAKKAPDGGFFGRLFAEREEIPLPTQATLEAYAALARETLAHVAGWPTATSRALFARVGAAGSTRRTIAQRPPPAAPPVPSAPSIAARAPRKDWMRDFLDAHEAPRLTPVRPEPARPEPTRPDPARPDWMSDFD